MKVVGKKLVVEEEVGEAEGARRATGDSPSGTPAAEAVRAEAAPETEVVAKAQRRRFTAEYKRRILREADRATEPGAIGALLRREGLYSSHLTTWRAARERGELAGLAPKRRGPKGAPPDPRDKKIVEQAREIVRLTKRAERAEALVELQKKVAALLGTPLESEP
jgi:transposase-like protein